MRASRQNSIGEASKDPALPAIGAPAVERVQQEFAEIRPSCHDFNYMLRRAKHRAPDGLKRLPRF